MKNSNQNCGLWPIVKLDADTDPKQTRDTRDTTEFPRVKPLQPWSPYLDYSEERAEQQRQREIQSIKNFFEELGVFICMAILFACLFLFY